MVTRLTFIFAVLAMSFQFAQNLDAVCAKCQRIREENAKIEQKYKYYEDYLRANGRAMDDEEDISVSIDEDEDDAQDESSDSNSKW